LQRGVIPYYLHHPDLTPGTQHFRVSLREGLEIMRELRGTQSGIGLPTYVIDIPEGGGKVPVESAWVTASDDPREWMLKSPLTGAIHRYSDLAEGARDATI
ncbi:MAG: lysine 2,3-aminomutase, partial [Myxococcota bacterium]|nr:lysine 2,3-aminomutase [Myxococcota bacterium]